MSLLAALVATLGKQWPNRYLSTLADRWGERRHRYDSLEK